MSDVYAAIDAIRQRTGDLGRHIASQIAKSKSSELNYQPSSVGPVEVKGKKGRKARRGRKLLLAKEITEEGEIIVLEEGVS